MEAIDLFLKYVTYDTQSNEESSTCPSSSQQLFLADVLLTRLKKLGARDISMELGYVYATIPASEGSEGKPAVAFLAHMDTATECSGKNVKARLLEKYDGGDILLNPELGIRTKVEDFPELKKHIGESLVVTDGTTLLGADDKAGIAAIMTAAEHWLKDKSKKHPEVRIIFTPDEEIGRGVDHIRMDKVNAVCGYTIDGGDVEELSYENFNAASAEVEITGVGVHPGSAYGIMKNASLLAAEFISLLPADETPAATRDREGFYHLLGMEGDVEHAHLSYILRDHDSGKLEERKEAVLRAAEKLNEKYGEGTCKAAVKDSYRNMIEKILPDNAFVIENAREALREVGITPVESPIRGGTDGANLSFMGLPCPNLGAGAGYCHGIHEFLSVDGLNKSVDIIEKIAERMA